MEVKEFIESGILELYVLDALNPLERDEVHGMAQRHPEVRQEIESIERGMENFAMEQAKEPSVALYDKISNSITFSDSETENQSNSLSGLKTGNLRTDQDKSGNYEGNHEGAKITSLDDAGKGNVIPMYPVKFYAYALAACFTLLLVSAFSMYNLWSELKITRTKYNELAAQNKTYGSQVVFLNSELGRSRSLMGNPDFKKLALNGTPAHSNTKAVVWWNTKKHTVMIDPEGLPNTDKDHSYQLWAIVKGKPVDAGVFDVKGDLKSVSQLKDIESAQAFAVTLEPRGGSAKPTMSEMYVMASI